MYLNSWNDPVNDRIILLEEKSPDYLISVIARLA